MKTALKLVAPAGFLLVIALYAPLFYAARRLTSLSDLLLALACTAFVFVPLHFGLLLEHRRASRRQLPGIILVVLITALISAAVIYQYRLEHSDPGGLAVALPIVIAYVCMFPLYGVAWLIAWICHRAFGIPWGAGHSNEATTNNAS